MAFFGIFLSLFLSLSFLWHSTSRWR